MVRMKAGWELSIHLMYTFKHMQVGDARRPVKRFVFKGQLGVPSNGENMYLYITRPHFIQVIMGCLVFKKYHNAILHSPRYDVTVSIIELKENHPTSYLTEEYIESIVYMYDDDLLDEDVLDNK